MTKIINLLASSMLLLTFNSSAGVFTLDFEGTGDRAQVLDYYNGGTDSLGNSGTDYGISFGSNTLSVIDLDAGGSGNVANEPSPNTIMFWLEGSAILNYDSGFDTGFSFYYSAFEDAKVSVYDGVNASGNLLGEISLFGNYNANGCTGDPFGEYCNWDVGELGFSGVAKSVEFSGAADQVGFDNVTFGSTTPPAVTPVPEADTLALLLFGFSILGFLSKKRV